MNYKKNLKKSNKNKKMLTSASRRRGEGATTDLGRGGARATRTAGSGRRRCLGGAGCGDGVGSVRGAGDDGGDDDDEQGVGAEGGVGGGENEELNEIFDKCCIYSKSIGPGS